MKRARYILMIIFCCHFLLGVAQSGATIKTSVDKYTIFLGEPLQLTITISYPQQEGHLFTFPDTIPHFEFLEKPVVDSVFENGKISLKTVYYLTSFNSGRWVIPSYKLTGSIISDTIPIDIVFSDFDPQQEYHDIKDILEVKPVAKNDFWWYMIGGLLVLALLVYYFLRRKKMMQVVGNDNISTNPYEDAIKQLRLLKQSTVSSKIYHAKLTEIFRIYVSRKKGICSLQKTTNDLVLQLQELKWQPGQFEKLSQALRLSDFVKFAKYNPTNDDNENCFDTIYNTIRIMEQADVNQTIQDNTD